MTKPIQSRKRTKARVGIGRSAVSRDSKPAVSASDAALYLRLRIAIDSISALSMKYYSSARSLAGREARVREIERRATELQRKFLTDMGFEGCPPGFKDCGGRCIPVDQNCLL